MWVLFLCARNEPNRRKMVVGQFFRQYFESITQRVNSAQCFVWKFLAHKELLACKTLHNSLTSKGRFSFTQNLWATHPLVWIIHTPKQADKSACTWPKDIFWPLFKTLHNQIDRIFSSAEKKIENWEIFVTATLLLWPGDQKLSKSKMYAVGKAPKRAPWVPLGERWNCGHSFFCQQETQAK